MQKIRKIETYTYLSSGKEYLLVRLETDQGVVGAGEATWFGHTEEVKKCIEECVAPAVIGWDIDCSNRIVDVCYPKDDPSAHAMRRAVTGVELAAMDALGKALGLPVYKLIGGEGKPFMEVIGEDPACEETNIVRFSVPEGRYTGNMLRPILKCCGSTEKPIVTDFVKAPELPDALQMLDALRQVEPHYVSGILSEENVEDWAEISSASRVPLSARFDSRFDACPLMEDADMSIVECEVLESGGIWSMKLLGSYAETYYINFATRCEGGPVAAMAGAQVMKSLPNAKGCSMPVDTLDEILCAPFSISNVEQAGLGVQIDWSKLA